MSKRTHDQQVARGRDKRAADPMERRKRRSQIVIIVMVVLLVLSLVGTALVGLAGGGDPEPSIDDLEEQLAELQAEGGPPEDIELCPAADDAPEPIEQEFDEPPVFELAADAEVTATFVTTCGDVVVELLPGDAPVAVGNFVGLVEEGFYTGTPFHRTQWDFVIQGGDPSGDGTGGPGYSIEDELELPATFEPFGDQLVEYPRGTLAMANRGPDTAGSQFFVVQADPGYPFPPDYTVFAAVLEGMDVIDRIAAGAEEGSIAVDPVVVIEVVVDGLPDEPQMDDGDADEAGDGDEDQDDEDDGDAAEGA